METKQNVEFVRHPAQKHGLGARSVIASLAPSAAAIPGSGEAAGSQMDSLPSIRSTSVSRRAERGFHSDPIHGGPQGGFFKSEKISKNFSHFVLNPRFLP